MKEGKVFSTAAAVAKKLRPGKPMLVGALLSVASRSLRWRQATTRRSRA